MAAPHNVFRMGEAAVPRRRGRVLVVEDDPHVRFGVSMALRSAGYEVFEAETCSEALKRVRESAPDVIVADLRLPDGSALDLLPRVRAVDAGVQILLMTGYGTIDMAVAAVKQGAEDFLTKPVDLTRLVGFVKAAADKRASMRTSAKTRAYTELESFSPVMRRLEEQVERLRSSEHTVLILGETGTGKSVLARRIHEIGLRAKAPFVDINCAGLTRDLVESELFGHERGAFTGAHAQKAGLFDAANGGTLFLDEIGDIDMLVQPKILKVLEERRFRRVGDVREREVDVRLVCATHHDLLGAVASRSFRADLYYRISTVTLYMPALRERPEDIVPLSRHLLAQQTGEQVDLTPGAEQRLLSYAFPGNIRELKNVLDRALLHRRGSEICEDDIVLDATSAPPPVSSSQIVVGHAPLSSSRLLGSSASTATREEIERQHIELALEAENGRVEAAAKRLGMPRSTLYQKIKEYRMVAGRAHGSRRADSGA